MALKLMSLLDLYDPKIALFLIILLPLITVFFKRTRIISTCSNEPIEATESQEGPKSTDKYGRMVPDRTHLACMIPTK